MLSRDLIHRLICLLDLSSGFLRGKAFQLHMAVGVIPDQMSLFLHPFYRLRVFFHRSADQEEGSFHSPLLQPIQETLRIRSRPVVEGKGDPGPRLRNLLLPDRLPAYQDCALPARRSHCQREKDQPGKHPDPLQLSRHFQSSSLPFPLSLLSYEGKENPMKCH